MISNCFFIFWQQRQASSRYIYIFILNCSRWPHTTMFSTYCTMQTSWVGLCMIVYFRGIFLFFLGGGVIKVLRDIDRLIIKIVSMHEQICLAFLRNLKRIKGLMNYGIFLSLMEHFNVYIKWQCNKNKKNIWIILLYKQFKLIGGYISQLLQSIKVSFNAVF